LHKLFEKYRKSQHREFFRISLSDAISKAMPLVLSKVENEAMEPSATDHGAFALTFDETEILVTLVHDKFARALAADDLARETGLHVQKTLLNCAKLMNFGLIRSSRDRHSFGEKFELTHKGRQYCFDAEIVIPEILEDEK